MATRTKTRTTGQIDVDSGQWTDDEIAAMKEHASELKRTKGRTTQADKDAEGEADAVSKIKAMPEADRVIARRIHEIVKDVAPHLAARTWYGMPAYTKDGKVVCFFKAASKFNGRYATFGFEEQAALDDGQMWATSWAITKLTADGEKQIAQLVRKAAG